MEPVVTWLVSVKNGMPYLPQTLASIRAQTFRKYEVLVWVNGSEDGTLEELHKWIPSMLPGRVVADHPTTLASSRAAAVEAARSEFCAIIDADDIAHPQRLEKQLAAMRADPSLGLLGTAAQFIDATGGAVGTPAEPAQTHDQIVDDFLYANPIVQPSTLLRRDAVLAAGNYRETGNVTSEDADLWYRLALGSRCANLCDPLVQFRIRDEGATNTSRRAGRLMPTFNQVFASHAPALYGLSETEARLLRQRQHRGILPLMVRTARHLENLHGTPWWQRLRTRSYLRAWRSLSPLDARATRLTIRLLSFNAAGVHS